MTRAFDLWLWKQSILLSAIDHALIELERLSEGSPPPFGTSYVLIPEGVPSRAEQS